VGQAALFSIRTDPPVVEPWLDAHIPVELSLFGGIVDRLPDGVVITAESHPPRILYVNPAFAALSGCTPSEVLGESVDTIAYLSPPHSAPLWRSIVSGHLLNGGAYSGNVILDRADGSRVHASL